MPFEQVHTLTWNANTEPDLAGYRVLAGRATTVYGDLNTPLDVGNVTSWRFAVTSPGLWYFSAKAYDTSNNESTAATEIIGNFQQGRFTSQHTISWTANTEPDLLGYYVLIGRFTGVYGSLGSPIDVGNVTSYQFTIDDSGFWYFAVKAYDTSLNLSNASTEVVKNWLILGNTI